LPQFDEKAKKTGRHESNCSAKKEDKGERKKRMIQPVNCSKIKRWMKDEKINSYSGEFRK
jgi:hypothetical protein